jgi:hypothetical protein
MLVDADPSFSFSSISQMSSRLKTEPQLSRTFLRKPDAGWGPFSSGGAVQPPCAAETDGDATVLFVLPSDVPLDGHGTEVVEEQQERLTRVAPSSLGRDQAMLLASHLPLIASKLGPGWPLSSSVAADLLAERATSTT